METKNLKRRDDAILISFTTLRRAVGLLGITFPFIMIIGSVCCGGYSEIQSSISAYYHTNMRNIFVGILSAIALFLFAYKGYKAIDDIIGNMASVFAFGAAFFPTSLKGDLTHCITTPLNNHIIGMIHNICAGGFLLMLMFYSLFLFTKTDKYKAATCMKKWRNGIYISVGTLMLACLILILILITGDSDWIQRWKENKAIFWLESIALISFGISWFVKGNTILVDKEEKLKPPFPYLKSVLYR